MWARLISYGHGTYAPIRSFVPGDEPPVFKGGISVAQSIKLVCAIIKPLKLDYILESLALIGIRSLTVTETKGYGQKGPTEFYRGAEFTAKFRIMIKIEVAVTAHQVEAVVETILRGANTGQMGDGRIFVSQLDQVWNIRTSDTEEAVPPLAA
jgi:nitrogen regulatory protein P-II 2